MTYREDYQTAKTGDPYRSQGERRIATLFDQLGLPVRYEHPLAVVDQGKTRIYYPHVKL